jgi:membrane protein
VWRLLLEVRDEYVEDRAPDVAAGTTYWLLVSLPAGVLAMMSALGWLGGLIGTDLARQFEEDTIDLLRRVLADEAGVIVSAIEQLFAQPNPGLLTTSVAVAVFSLSRGFAGLIRGLDAAYDIEDRRNWFHIRALAIGISLGTLATIAATVVVQVSVAGLVPGGLGGAVLRWGVALTVLVLWAATVFHVAPHHRSPWRYDLPGAFLVAVTWAVVSAGFELYVRLVAGGNQVLGVVGGAILALTWLYVNVLALVVGAEVNAVLARRAGVVERRTSLWRRVGDWTGSP